MYKMKPLTPTKAPGKADNNEGPKGVADERGRRPNGSMHFEVCAVNNGNETARELDWCIRHGEFYRQV